MRNYMDGPDDYTTEFVDNTVGDVKDLTSDLTKVKSYATGKNPTMKEIAESKEEEMLLSLQKIIHQNTQQIVVLNTIMETKISNCIQENMHQAVLLAC